MSKTGGKFTRHAPPKAGRSPIITSPVPDMVTHEGGAAYSRDAKSELFLLAVANMVGEDTFYETGRARDARFKGLVHQVTREDPAWVRGFIPYLRTTMLLRSGAVVMAAEYVRAGGPEGRRVVDSALQRADEPAEMLGYWTTQYGRRIPKPVKRGVADAARRLFTENAALKYDGRDRAWRLGDVVEMVHPKPRDTKQAALFRFLLDARRGREDSWSRYPGWVELLPRLHATEVLDKTPVEQRRVRMDTPLFTQASMPWERVSGWLQGAMDAEAWSKVIPHMGYMALLRNLRNFDAAGVPEEVLRHVAAMLESPDEVMRSRQLPIRFYSAYKAVRTMRWGQVLEQALQYAVSNVPQVGGRTLVMVDLSGSMFSAGLGERSQVQRFELASVFAAAFAARNPSDVWAYSADTGRVDVQPGDSVLRAMERIRDWPGAGGSTYTWGSVGRAYRAGSHDRVLILTDEQSHDDYRMGRGVVPLDVPIYVFNLAGYRGATMPTGQGGRRYTFGGLTDAAFRVLPILEGVGSTGWPWEENGSGS